MTRAPYPGRRRTERLLVVVVTVLALLALLALAGVVGSVLVRGALGLVGAWNDGPSGATGAWGDAVTGTVLLVLGATALAVPVGVLAGLYLSELGSNGFGRAVRLGADTLSGTPSALVGLFVYELLVPAGRSWVLGSVALALVMVPVLARATERFLGAVPHALREGSLALGVPRWRFAFRVLLRTALPGIGAAVLSTMARAAGETAPLLFTARGVPSLPVYVFDGAPSSPPSELWAASLLMVALAFFLDGLARALAGREGPSS